LFHDRECAVEITFSTAPGVVAQSESSGPDANPLMPTETRDLQSARNHALVIADVVEMAVAMDGERRTTSEISLNSEPGGSGA